MRIFSLKAKEHEMHFADKREMFCIIYLNNKKVISLLLLLLFAY